MLFRSSSSRSLLNISCIFLIRASILFLRSWIIFTIITLNCFSGRLPISSSFIWSVRFLPCSYICDIFFCLFFLLILLCLGSPFHRLQVRSSHCFWYLSPVARLVVGVGIRVALGIVDSFDSGSLEIGRASCRERVSSPV